LYPAPKSKSHSAPVSRSRQ